MFYEIGPAKTASLLKFVYSCMFYEIGTAKTASLLKSVYSCMFYEIAFAKTASLFILVCFMKSALQRLQTNQTWVD